MINGLDLFSGIGGLARALEPWVQPVAYCENERYAQANLVCLMEKGLLPTAPIWDDVATLKSVDIPRIDIISGGFPCQDISVAGHGVGLEGKRSGLFFEVCRLVEEIKPGFVFLENVPAIRTRGLREVIRAFTDLRYDCRWTCVSAAEVGAPHLRKRWFLLAHPSSKRRQQNTASAHGDESPNERRGEKKDHVTERHGEGNSAEQISTPVAYSPGIGGRARAGKSCGPRGKNNSVREAGWKTEPDVDRVVNGLPFRVDRIKGLGNAVVPAQAREAFQKLMGYK